jgi:ABC-type transport system involved in multi-copper enzyme maturation permease subunit
MRLIEFELLRLLKNKKTLLIVISCVLFSIIFVGYNHYQHNRYIEDTIQKLENDSSLAKQRVEFLFKLKSLNDRQKEELEFWGPEVVTTSFLKTYYSSPALFDWKDILKKTNDRNLNLIVGYQKEYIFIYSQSIESKIKDLENENDLNHYLLEHNIDPLLTPYYPSSFNLLYLLNSKEFMLMMMVLFIVSVIDIFSSEFESGAYKITYTSPYTRIQIIQTKILISSIFVSFLYIIIPVFVFLLSSMMTGIGNPEYPVLVNSLGEYQFITVMQFILMSFSYYWLQLIFLVFLCSLVFVIIKESASMVSILSGVFLMIYLISSSRSLSFMNYLPLGSFDLITILQNFGFTRIPLFSILNIVFIGIIVVIDRILIKRISFTGGK